MITIKKFMETIDFKINEGFKFQWDCYGPNACSIGWEKKKDNKWFSAGIVYDIQTQQVYEMSVWDDTREKVYRWINPKFIRKVREEYKKRGLNFKVALDKHLKYEDLSPTRILNKLRKLKEEI